MHSLTHETICLADCQMELVLCHCLAAGAISIRIDVLITSQSQVGYAECKIMTVKSDEFLILIRRNVSKCSTFSEEYFFLARLNKRLQKFISLSTYKLIFNQHAIYNSEVQI